MGSVLQVYQMPPVLEAGSLAAEENESGPAPF
jgi:hypothetical protein